MKNVNLVKIVNIVTLVALLVLVAAPLATSAQFDLPDPQGSKTNLPSDTNVSGLLFRVIQIMLAIAGLVAVIFLIIGGFRYITAGGNEEASEAAKKTITNAIIGVVIIILSFVIVRVVANAVKGTV